MAEIEGKLPEHYKKMEIPLPDGTVGVITYADFPTEKKEEEIIPKPSNDDILSQILINQAMILQKLNGGGE